MGAVAIFKGKLVKFLAKAGILVPTRTTIERSTSPTAGELAFNTDSKKVEVYDGAAWADVASNITEVKPDPFVPFEGLVYNSSGYLLNQQPYVKPAPDNLSLYVYGAFDYIAKKSDVILFNGASLNTTDASLSTVKLKLFNNYTACSVVSGNFIFVGGDFTYYGNSYANRIVKISLLTGEIDSTFSTGTGFNSTVRALAIDGLGNLYAGGNFTTYNGITRQRIAKLNATTGALDTTFDTTTGFGSSSVLSIAFDSSNNVYCGGDFTTYKSITRQRIAKLNGTTAALDTTFDSAVGFNTTVYSICLDSSNNLYCAGNFSTYKGTTRQFIAKLNSTDATLIAGFDTTSGFSGGVSAIVVDSSGNLYAGGSFTTYKGTTRQYIAKIKTADASLDTTFDSVSGFNNAVTSIQIDASNNLYCAGNNITTYKGINRKCVAKLNATTAALDASFDSSTGFTGDALQILNVSLYSNQFLVFGLFDNYKSVNIWTTRQKIAKINPTTFTIDTTFNSSNGFNSTVNNIAFDSTGNLYAVGNFNTYGGTTRQRIAKLNPNTAVLDSTFNSASGFDANVYDIVIDSSNNIYCAGFFTAYAGTTRQRIIKLNSTTAALDTTFDSSTGFDSTVNTIQIDSSNGLYCGGDFSTYKGTARNRLAKLNATTAALDTTFDTTTSGGLNNPVYKILLDSGTGLFVGGSFSFYRGQFIYNLIKVDRTTANLDSTFASSGKLPGSQYIYSMVQDSSNGLYLLGNISTYNSVNLQGLVKINATTAALDTTFDTTIGITRASDLTINNRLNLSFLSSTNEILLALPNLTYKNITSGTLRISASTASISTVQIALGTYTLTSTDNGKKLYVNSTSAVTIVVPTGLVIGFNCEIIQIGAGAITVAGASGVTVNSSDGSLTTNGQYKSANIASYGTNTYLMTKV